VADRELETLRDSLREHVNALAVDIGPRTPLQRDSSVHAANYIYSVFEESGFSLREQDYQYFGQRVTNVLATHPTRTSASDYYVVGASALATEGACYVRCFHARGAQAYLMGHQGSRIFVRGSQTSGDHVLGAINLRDGRLHGVPPAIHI